MPKRLEEPRRKRRDELMFAGVLMTFQPETEMGEI
jgi:hypothetical protein